ncbi:uncharacterized protein LOC124499556 [Dermatophagoides farinae]|uniref:Uncharacterized protein n=1 Tax=Dermatophagoides farinae TaxID=6954 RepID=A0A9D4PA23_DERFA|nr:uncharacterized protein LOC124499556 [Dermatophagoides farinae]KAH7645965.1 hypothetical protein HUG17_1503 [Dermatophagoides farinae]
MLNMEDLDKIPDIYGFLTPETTIMATTTDEIIIETNEHQLSSISNVESDSLISTLSPSPMTTNQNRHSIGSLETIPNSNNDGLLSPTSAAIKNQTESQFFDFIFFFCSLLDFFIVQPMNYFTSEENVSSLPFYFSS